MKTTTKYLLVKTAIVATFALAAVAIWSADPPADETATVTVKTLPRVMRVVVDLNEAGALVKIDGYLFMLRLDNDVLVNQRQLGSKSFTKAELQAAGVVQSNFVVRLEQCATWIKQNWNEVPVQPVLEEP